MQQLPETYVTENVLYSIEDTVQEPVNVDELRTRFQLSSSLHDELLGSLITKARVIVERHLGVSLVPQIRQVVFSSLGESHTLLYGPVREVVSKPDSFVFPAGSFPFLTGNYPEGLTIRYAAGYGQGGLPLPEDYKEAVILLIREMFEADSGETLPGTKHERGFWKRRLKRNVTPFS